MPNRVWVTDITYIATDEGRLYLAGVKDLFRGELVGYAMSKRMTAPLVMQALFRAVVAKRPENGLLHHSDRGSQYCAHAYQKLLRQFGMQASMSRKGNCWERADGKFLGCSKNRIGASPAFLHPRTGSARNHRIHRDLLSPYS